MKALRFLPLCLLLLTAGACKKTDDNSINLFSVQDDIDLGAQLDAEIRANPNEYPLLPRNAQNAEAYGYYDNIIKAVLDTASLNYRDKFEWEFEIIQGDSILNAFAGPGGKIFTYTGLIKFLKSEDQLAGVLAHEIAHADRRHVTDQMTKSYGISVLLDIVLGKDRSKLAEIAAGLVTLKFSRNAEAEADDFSVRYLCPTSYDARGASRFFEQLIAGGQTGGGPPPFLSTHPSPDNRVEDIQALWAKECNKVGSTYDARYQQFKNSLP